MPIVVFGGNSAIEVDSLDLDGFEQAVTEARTDGKEYVRMVSRYGTEHAFRIDSIALVVDNAPVPAE